jgi:3-hydroxybutyryl-CoA dehydrogenase
MGMQIAVIGAGFMGGGIAAEFALRLPDADAVRVWDASPDAASRALERARDVARLLDEAGVLRGAGVDARLARLSVAPSLEAAVQGAAYVAEAVPEDLALKRATFKRLDAATAPETVLASNTSGYDPADLARDLRHPQRVLVAHYFGPGYLIPLVEVVPHAGTAEWAVERAVGLLGAAGKRAVRLGKFAPGFVANRLQMALFREALHLVRDGIATPEAIDEIVRFSFGPRLAALGPFTVADLAGLDVYASIATNVWPGLSTERAAGAPPPELASRVAAGATGAKAGAGFYPWPTDALQRITARRDAALLAALRAERDDAS